MSDDRLRIAPDQAKQPLFAGVDLGGTNIKVGIVDDDGRTVAYDSVPTETERGPEDATQRMAEAVVSAARRVGVGQSQIVAVGLGSPGTMDIPAGKLLHPVNLPGWDQFPIRDRLAEHLDMPVTFANDAGAAAYGEYWVGSGRDYRSMVLFTLGTGIGCGIIIDGMSIDGEHSHGAECGHIIIDYHDDAPTIPTGQRGHLEAFASATAVIRRTHEELDKGRESSLQRRRAAGDEITPLLVAEEAEKGDELADEIVMNTARFIGVGAVTLMHTIDPAAVVLGGAMTFGGHDTELGRRFLARIREEVQHRAFPTLAAKTIIDFAQMGGDAGYIGAAGLAREAYRKQPS
ncbi:MAG: ROK family protein [Pirellulales bacterium]|nr:ROK family protein [Pirellulales bacterium]